MAESQAGEIDSEIEEVWRAFSALSERKQLEIMLRACQLRGWALKLGRARRVPAVDEESAVGLLPEAAPATYDTAIDSRPEQQEGGADVSADDLQHPAGDVVSKAADQEPELAMDLPTEVAPATDAVAEQAEHGDDVAVAHAEVDDEAAAVQASQGDNGAELGAEDLEDAGDDIPDAADPEIGVTKCAHCKKPLLSSDLPRKKYGRLYHRADCVSHAKPIAVAA